MADNVIRNTRGGQYASGVITGAATETLVFTGQGMLSTISFITVGTVAISIYDGTQSTGGALIYTSATNPSAGMLETPLPFSTGICVKGTSTASHGVNVGYCKSGPNGI